MTGDTPGLSSCESDATGHMATATPSEPTGGPRTTCDEHCPKGIQWVEHMSGVSGSLHIPGYGVIRAWAGATYQAGGLEACKKEVTYLLSREWVKAGKPGL